MHKRMTKEQKEAVRQYWLTVASQDRYLGSVFVSEAQTAYYERLIAEREAVCESLGVAQSVAVLA